MDATVTEEQQRRDAMRHELSALGRVVDSLEEEPELAREFRRIGEAFQSLTEQTDPVFRQVATTKLLSVAEELGQIAMGTIVFRETESWRTAYQNLLRSEKLKLYRSVAWVQCADYWQDAPGRQSMRENYDAINRGVIVERIIILPREFWPPERLLPTDDVLPWIMDQHNHGVWVLLCLEHEVEAEPELPMDFGIYGQSAVGVQSLDRSCRTLEFKLQFGGEAIRLAEDRWNRLKLHTTQLRTLLDSPSQDA